MCDKIDEELVNSLRQENNRLLKQLLFVQNFIKTFENYRNSIKSLLINCKCNKNYKQKFYDLEKKFDSNLEKQNQLNKEIEENLRKHYNVFSEKSKEKLIQKT